MIDFTHILHGYFIALVPTLTQRKAIKIIDSVTQLNSLKSSDTYMGQ